MVFRLLLCSRKPLFDLMRIWLVAGIVAGKQADIVILCRDRSPPSVILADPRSVLAALLLLNDQCDLAVFRSRFRSPDNPCREFRRLCASIRGAYKPVTFPVICLHQGVSFRLCKFPPSRFGPGTHRPPRCPPNPPNRIAWLFVQHFSEPYFVAFAVEQGYVPKVRPLASRSKPRHPL